MVYDAGGPATTSLFELSKIWLPLSVQEEKGSEKINKNKQEQEIKR